MNEPTPPDTIQARILAVLTEPLNGNQVYERLRAEGYKHSSAIVYDNLRKLVHANKVIEVDVMQRWHYKHVVYKRAEKGIGE